MIIYILLRYPSSYAHSLAVWSRANNLRWLLVLIKLIHVLQLLFISEGAVSWPVPAICWHRIALSICQHLELPWKWLGCTSILGKTLSLEKPAVWGQWGDMGLTWQSSPEGRDMALLQGRDFCFNAESVQLCLWLVCFLIKNCEVQGLPWYSSVWDPALPKQGAWVRFLVGKPDPTHLNRRSHSEDRRSWVPQLRPKAAKISNNK